MIFHEDTVVIGDKVFDINRGNGVVISVTDRLFEVEFKTVRTFYDTNGVQKDKVTQTLFWHKPFIIAPRKNEVATRDLKRKFDAILELVKTIS